MLLALRRRWPRDLRQIASVLKLAPEIERSADLCCNICKAARRIYGHDLDPKLRGLIQKMSDQAQKEYKEGVEAYVAIDGVRSAALARHGRPARRHPPPVHRPDPREPCRRHDRPPGRRPARRRRPLLRAARRSCRQHRQPHPVHRDRRPPEHEAAPAPARSAVPSAATSEPDDASPSLLTLVGVAAVRSSVWIGHRAERDVWRTPSAGAMCPPTGACSPTRSSITRPAS